MEELKKYLEELKTEASAELGAINEEFLDDNENNNFYYYSGFYSALESVLDFIETGRKKVIV